MKITVTGRKVNLRENFKELATKKLSRFDRIFDEDAQANVVVSLERNRQTVEITIKSRGMIYRAERVLYTSGFACGNEKLPRLFTNSSRLDDPAPMPLRTEQSLTRRIARGVNP